MSSSIAVTFLLVVSLAFFSRQSVAYPAILSGDDGGPVGIVVDPDEYGERI